jgi:hypothetical protein
MSFLGAIAEALGGLGQAAATTTAVAAGAVGKTAEITNDVLEIGGLRNTPLNAGLGIIADAGDAVGGLGAPSATATAASPAASTQSPFGDLGVDFAALGRGMMNMLTPNNEQQVNSVPIIAQAVPQQTKTAFDVAADEIGHLSAQFSKVSSGNVGMGYA